MSKIKGKTLTAFKTIKPGFSANSVSATSPFHQFPRFQKKLKFKNYFIHFKLISLF